MAKAQKKAAADVKSAESNKTLAALIETIRINQPKFALQASDEVYTDYLARVIKAVGQVSDEDFDKMPADVQEYWNTAARAMKKGSDLPMPPDYEAAAALPVPAPEAAKKGKAKLAVVPAADPEPPAADPEPPVEGPDLPGEEPEGDAPEPDDAADGDADEPLPEAATAEEPEATGDAVQGKTKRAKGAKKAKEPKTRKNLIHGFSVIDMRKMVIENPSITVAELMKVADDKGITGIQKSTVTIARATTLTVIRLMKDTGHWKD